MHVEDAELFTALFTSTRVVPQLIFDLGLSSLAPFRISFRSALIQTPILQTQKQRIHPCNTQVGENERTIERTTEQTAMAWAVETSTPSLISHPSTLLMGFLNIHTGCILCILRISTLPAPLVVKLQHQMQNETLISHLYTSPLTHSRHGRISITVKIDAWVRLLILVPPRSSSL